MSLPSGNDANHANAPSWMKSADVKFETLNNRIESVLLDMKTVLRNQDRVEEMLKAHLPVVMDPRCSHTAPDSERGRPPSPHTTVTDNKQGNKARNKNKKKNKKKKAKGDGSKVVAANWAAGNLIKIMVGLFSLALLVSMALGLGQGGVWGSDPSLLRKRTDQSLAAPTSYIGTTGVGSQDTTRSTKQPGDDANEEASKLEPIESLLAHPPQATETHVPTTSPTVSGSESAPVISDLSQAKHSHVPSSVPTPMDTSGPPTRTIHHQDPHHLDHLNHGDNDITHINGPATEASIEPTHSQTSSSYDDQDDKRTDDITEINGDNGHDDLFLDQDEHGIENIPESHEDYDHDEPTEDQDDPDNDETPAGHEEGDNHDEHVCASDEEKCGCLGLNQADYRGPINTISFGTPCERWDADWVREQLDYTEQQYIDAGLEENYCRNPRTRNLSNRKRAWCFKTGGSGWRDWEYCSVPNCRRATPVCSIADKNTCGCDAVLQSDYRGTMNTTKDGVQCAAWYDYALQKYTGFGLESNNNNSEGNNFCRNPFLHSINLAFCFTDDDDGWGPCDVPMCTPDECPPFVCGTQNVFNSGCPSFWQAENCCEGEEDTSSCKCGYLQEACRKSLKNGIADFCDDAEAACNEGKYDLHYKCRMYEQICSELKSESVCELAATSCCELNVAWFTESQCFCDFFTYTTDVLNVRGNSASMSEKCLEAAKTISGTYLPSYDALELEKFYKDSGGEHWFNNDGWLDDENHCYWFGVACNDDGFVIKVDLRNNNLTGINSFYHVEFPELTWLDLAENNLSGTAYRGVTLYLRKLVHIDISKNQFSGHVDMTFSPSAVHANYSHNKFTSAGFNKFNAAYESIRVVDLSSNHINHAATDFFVNIPPNLEELYLSNNNIRGALPVPFPSLNNLRRFAMANNNINGPLPDFSRFTPRVRELDLSNQKRNGDGGFTGMIADDISRLDDLLVLNLAVNNLTSIPVDLGNLPKLKTINFSSNFLDQFIPADLGNLGGVLDSLDLSDNRLKGLIPKEFDQFVETSIHLRGNPDILYPAPLMVCSQGEFDLANETEMCPPERNALKNFFESAKGQDWTNNTLWMDPYEDFCKWHGVTCSEKNHTVEVNLTNNALSGTLSEHIAELTHLIILDLADNDLMGSIPKEIGRLSNLVRLRLPYNRFGGEMPSELKNLSELQLAQFHANRISGTMPLLDWNNQEQSSYIADCGNPSDFETSLACTECTMCCNAQGDCYPQEKTKVMEAGFKSYVVFALAFLAILLSISGILALALGAHDKYQNRQLPRENICSRELISRDEKYALGLIGEGSNYKFFTGKSWSGWIVAIATIGVQIWMLFIFVSGAEINLADETSALVYTWKCPRDRLECEFKGDVSTQGWVLFSILMGAYLTQDVINGCKLVVLSAKQRHDRNTRMRYFVGGTLLNAVTIFTFVVSVIYNFAIATSDVELVANSVIIIFITDLDEQLYGILEAINSSWVEEMSCEVRGSDDENSETIQGLRREMKDLRESFLLLQQQVRGGNVTQPQAAVGNSRHSNVSSRSRSSSGGGSDRSCSPPRFRNTHRQRGRNRAMAEF